NGKTTTAHMVASILDRAGRRVVHNRSGSNLVRGVLAALAAQSSASGAPRGDVGVIEADAAALPAIGSGRVPGVLPVNNLFRAPAPRRRRARHPARRREGAFPDRVKRGTRNAERGTRHAEHGLHT